MKPGSPIYLSISSEIVNPYDYGHVLSCFYLTYFLSIVRVVIVYADGVVGILLLLFALELE